VLRDKFKIDFIFVKVGSDFTDSQQQLMDKLGLGSRVRGLGRRDFAELPFFYNAADLFLFPSLYEGFGFPILEALSCGTPVVSSTVGSLPEVGGEAVYWVDPHDPENIARGTYHLLTDKNLQEKLRQKGFAQVRKFSWERTARQTLQVYREVHRAYSSP
jgi:glycosyltransferase involved in cell wall biosynthesis